MNDRLTYTPHEVAERMNVSERTVRRKVADGEIPSLDWNGPIRIPVAAFEAWLNEHVRGAA